jgi:hypothetical protein
MDIVGVPGGLRSTAHPAVLLCSYAMQTCALNVCDFPLNSFGMDTVGIPCELLRTIKPKHKTLDHRERLMTSMNLVVCLCLRR